MADPGFGGEGGYNGVGHGYGPGGYSHGLWYWDPFRVFYGLTGMTFLAFVSGFSVCLFDLNQVKECVDHAEKMREMLQASGEHMLAWGIKVVQEIFGRYPLGWR